MLAEERFAAASEHNNSIWRSSTTASIDLSVRTGRRILGRPSLTAHLAGEIAAVVGCALDAVFGSGVTPDAAASEVGGCVWPAFEARDPVTEGSDAASDIPPEARAHRSTASDPDSRRTGPCALSRTASTSSALMVASRVSGH